MRKIYLVMALMISIGGMAFAAIASPGFKPGAIDEKKYFIGIPENMEQIQVKETESQSYDFAFKDKANRYEIRYIMFVEDGQMADVATQAGFWAYLVSMNIAGDEKAIKNASKFKDEDVKAEFDADYGSTIFIADSASDYASGYKYIMANFYYKKGVGLMCQTILFNDLAIVKTEEFNGIFHTFKFLE